MNRVEQAFAGAKERGVGVLIPYVCPGDPAADTVERLVPALERAGAGVIEIGVPYSDPIADGPVIAAAMHRALMAGTTPEGVFEQVARVRGQVSCGLVAMVSVSLVHAAGIEAFIGRAKDAGFDGFIFSDAPLEESGELTAAAADAGLTCTLLVSPTTPKDRAERIARACTGFVYMLARSGITGERSDAPDVADRVRALRSATDTPIACGFGISSADHVRAVVNEADGAIVGSALVRRLSEASFRGEDYVRAGEAFTAELATGLSGHRDAPHA
ncbi:MAG: tryptophan synthase alpha chain [Phycisphaeraceae bacterium]|nr:MAG: tryptophan synthase alpha chain [Phycisphaeraceae bacterium]